MSSDLNAAITINDSESFMITNIELQLGEQRRHASPLWLSGSPGSGKTQVIGQLAVKYGFGLKVVHLSQAALEMITGLPKASIVTGKVAVILIENFINMIKGKTLEHFIKKDEALEAIKITKAFIELESNKSIEWTLPQILDFNQLEVKPSSPDKPIILLLDDAHLINKSLQVYFFQLLTDKQIHNHPLPPNVAILMAGNRAIDKAGFNPILAPVSNRIFFLDVCNPCESWIANFAAKEVRLDIIIFLRQDPNKLTDEPMESQPWASNRSWTNLSKYLDQWEKNHGVIRDIKLLLKITEGHVGKVAASNFVKFKVTLAEWKADEILTGHAEIPNISSMVASKAYCLLTACINELLRFYRDPEMKIKTVPKALEILKGIMSKMIEYHKSIVTPSMKNLLLGETGTAGGDKLELVRAFLNDKMLVQVVKDMMNN